MPISCQLMTVTLCLLGGSVNAAAGESPVSAAEAGAARISFVNDVLPVLSKLGCNQGTCHGSAAGKWPSAISPQRSAPRYRLRPDG
jgi:hypothetical protein